MIILKELSIEDIEEIKQLFVEVFTNEPWNDDWSDPKQLHEYLIDLIDNRNSMTFGLYEDDYLIGLSMGSILHFHNGTEYYIFEFCIKEEKQGKGIGTEFLKKIEDFIKEKQVSIIFLQTERTVPAYGFYKKNGFVELNDHISLYKDIH